MQVAARPAGSVSAPPAAVAAGAIVTAFLTGVGIAVGLSKGVALLLGLLYLPVALLNLPLAIALWVPLVYVSRFDVLGVAPSAAAILIGFAWLGTLRRHGSTVVALIKLHARRLALAGLFLVWLTLSIVWATDTRLATQDYWQWLMLAGAFVVVATSLSKPEYVRAVAAAFVVGALVSVLVGLLAHNLSTSASAVTVAADEQRRLGGGSADPNYLAAGLVPAIVLATGLLRRGRPLANLALGAAVIALTIGFIATESRGGLVAAAAALVAALALYRRRRAYVVAFVGLLVAVSAAWFSVNPHAWHRVTDFDSAGNGRSDLWRVAWRMAGDHPVAGVGLNNFTVKSRDYVDRPGSLKFVSLIVERPHVAHNTYLQLLAETGVVGLVLFLSVLLACMRAAWLAVRRFQLRDEHEHEALARSVLVACVAAAASSFFISNGQDLRLWLLLALGPALLSVAVRPYHHAAAQHGGP
jgi:O-antigen ligase